MSPSHSRSGTSDASRQDAGSKQNPSSSARGGWKPVSVQSLLKAGIGASDRRSTANSAWEAYLKVANVGSLLDSAQHNRQRVQRHLGVQIAQIDDAISRQVNAILHHPKFQKLEASWRGLQYLHELTVRENREDIKLKFLDASWRELEGDFKKQDDFDQSYLFKAVYENEFGQAGGHPFGVLIGDFEIRPHMSRDYQRDDLFVLRSIAQVAAAAFCPFISGASPAMFDFEDFSRLERSVDLDRYFDDRRFFRWQKLRDEEDSRFLGLTLPRVLMRLPYKDDPDRIDGFHFVEDVEYGPKLHKYLWGNAAYAFAGVLLRSFAQTGWFIDTRGVEPGIDGGGLVPGLTVAEFDTDSPGIAPKSKTDVVVSETLERTLSELGFIPICDLPGSEYAAFYTNRSIQKPQRYSADEAAASVRLSTMLQYMFCVSRFAHFLKVMARDLIGSLSTTDLERHLNNWIADYVCDADSSAEVKSSRPLENGRVRLVAIPGKAGAYQCAIELMPHTELEDLVASVRLTTELAPPQTV